MSVTREVCEPREWRALFSIFVLDFEYCNNLNFFVTISSESGSGVWGPFDFIIRAGTLFSVRLALI